MYRKVIVIILGLIIIAGTACSSLRIGSSDSREESYSVNSRKLVDDVIEKNIVTGPVAINKIIIKYRQGQESRRLKAYLRYNGKDSILLSVRTIAGIEAARALIGKDSIWVLDKINKVVYTANNEQIGEKYGVSYDMIKILFGDLEEMEVTERRMRCSNGITMIRDEDENGINEYIIDCNMLKMLEIKSYKRDGKQLYYGKFSDFVDENGVIYPERLEWSLDEENIQLEITISNIRRRDRISLNFEVPGYYDRGKIR